MEVKEILEENRSLRQLNAKLLNENDNLRARLANAHDLIKDMYSRWCGTEAIMTKAGEYLDKQNPGRKLRE